MGRTVKAPDLGSEVLIIVWLGVIFGNYLARVKPLSAALLCIMFYFITPNNLVAMFATTAKLPVH